MENFFIIFPIPYNTLPIIYKSRIKTEGASKKPQKSLPMINIVCISLIGTEPRFEVDIKNSSEKMINSAIMLMRSSEKIFNPMRYISIHFLIRPPEMPIKMNSIFFFKTPEEFYSRQCYKYLTDKRIFVHSMVV